MLCVNKLINEDKALQRLNEKSVSSNIFNLVFKEAILFGEFSLIAHLISIWPTNYLKLSELISSEIINYDSLSKPLFPSGPTILDYVLLGILISKPNSRLKTIDFTGFHKGSTISYFLLFILTLHLIRLIFRSQINARNISSVVVVVEARKSQLSEYKRQDKILLL